MATANQGTSGTQGRTGQSMGTSRGRTGTDDVTYNLVSIVYHALQGAETYEQYIQDAEQGGSRELAQFFRKVQQENEQRARQGCQLLAQQIGQGQQGGGRSGQHMQSGSQSSQQGSSSQSGGQQSQSGSSSTQQGSSGAGSGKGTGGSGGNANR